MKFHRTWCPWSENPGAHGELTGKVRWAEQTKAPDPPAGLALAHLPAVSVLFGIILDKLLYLLSLYRLHCREEIA